MSYLYIDGVLVYGHDPISWADSDEARERWDMQHQTMVGEGYEQPEQMGITHMNTKNGRRITIRHAHELFGDLARIRKGITHWVSVTVSGGRWVPVFCEPPHDYCLLAYQFEASE